jgi:indolepyruvate ferredoxin oxidoreductase beta subunit
VTEPRLVSVLIPAVGGQGGGVLLDWIVDAALLDGYPVHGTSIPGVARGGLDHVLRGDAC